MIIYGQNRDGFVNFDNARMISIDKIDGAYAITCMLDNSMVTILGEYKTEERAKEVLQSISRKYTGYIKDCKDNTLYNIPKIYEMPLS